MTEQLSNFNQDLRRMLVDNINIASLACVVKDCPEDNRTLRGVPATAYSKDAS